MGQRCQPPGISGLPALVFGFDPGKDYQFVERAPWIPTLGATYHIGIDGLGLLLVILTTLLGWISILSSWNAIRERLKEYYALFLLLQTAMLGVFMSLDFLLFFIFWETVLVPMYFIIAIWGAPRRTYTAIKFIIYTLIGSVLMLLGILTSASLLFITSTPSNSVPRASISPTYSKPASFLASSGGSSGPSSWALPSKCPCGRSTPGSPMRTSRRPPRDRLFWLASC